MGVNSFPASAGGVTGQQQAVFTSSGTWTAPTASTFNGYAEVLLVGGGAGNCSNSGTTGGSAIMRILPFVAGTGYTVTIGAGGVGNTTTGNNGTNSTLTYNGGTLTATGGKINSSTPQTQEGMGGYGTNGGVTGSNIAAPAGGAYGFGGGGGTHLAANNGAYGDGTWGGGSCNSGVIGTGAGGPGGANTGGGGGASASSSYNGGNGGSGICIITWWQ